MSHRAREKRGVSFRMGKKTPLLIPARALPRTSPPQDHPNSTLLGFRVKPHCLVLVFFFVWFVFVISSKCTFCNHILIANSIWVCLLYTYNQKDTQKHTDAQTRRHTHKQIDRQTHRQTDRQTDTQTDRQTDSLR